MSEKLFDLIMANIEENANFEGYEVRDVVLHINMIGGGTIEALLSNCDKQPEFLAAWTPLGTTYVPFTNIQSIRTTIKKS